ncbi:MAG: hypothetical protein QF781_09645 [Phycisphaerales bacterium]|nr:hypothetical protein [Phycisphaerales bacterium]MDP6312401.1 hypothetical protein [Phycisphaerales bacterium]MDP7086713.1 hypothetical protein [Phycisphaerales bacterium]MDP7190134.1 hypothetical protein [Phycisphaerales bacterium]MDP7519164.1 hypothetical protein [Phycisphaerales bacterium]|tara:strand:+ start:2297 stop:2797 length:501 start_codon:yes stop_codon:yes gene_type:complete
MNHETESDSTRPQKRVNMGCLALVGVLILGMVLVGVSIFRLNSMVTAYESRFQGDDWFTLEGKKIDQDTPLTAQTLVFGSDIILHGAETDIAILGGEATLHGRYKGTVFFLGKTLDVAPNAVITGPLSITAARHVTIRGTLEGGIEGNWDRLFGHNTPGTTTSNPP